MLMVDSREAFEALKKACLKAPVLAFAGFDNPFLLEIDASNLGLGAVLSQKQTNDQYHQVADASQYLTIHEHNYYSTKQEFLAIKWAIAEQFQEDLLWKPFIVRTDDLLTYIMTTPSLDATQHEWVESLVRLTFSIEYQKGRDNVATDTLSWVTLKLDAVIIKSNLHEVTIRMTNRSDAQDPGVAMADEDIQKPVQETVVLARVA